MDFWGTRQCNTLAEKPSVTTYTGELSESRRKNGERIVLSLALFFTTQKKRKEEDMTLRKEEYVKETQLKSDLNT